VDIVKALGIVLVVIGVLALGYHRLTAPEYVLPDGKEADLPAVEDTRAIHIPAWAGAVPLVVGLSLLLARRSQQVG
jgi:hypothetical protein